MTGEIGMNGSMDRVSAGRVGGVGSEAFARPCLLAGAVSRLGRRQQTRKRIPADREG